MIKNNLMMGLALAALMGTAACGYDRQEERAAPGRYEHHYSRVDDAGTRTDYDDTTDVTVKSNGKRHVSKKSKTTQDPKGLFNKKTTHESDEEMDQK